MYFSKATSTVGTSDFCYLIYEQSTAASTVGSRESTTKATLTVGTSELFFFLIFVINYSHSGPFPAVGSSDRFVIR